MPGSIFEKLMKATFYGQFTAGQSLENIRSKISTLHDDGIKTMLMIPIENIFADAREK